jgi:hypothetical protein
LARNKLYILVTYAGSLPFIACALILYSGISDVGSLGSISDLITMYALVIISFIAGIHLGTYLFYNTKTPKPLFIVSNIVAAVAWISLLFSNLSNAPFILGRAFIYLLGVDFLLKQEMFISPSYFVTRLIVTTVSASSLLFVSSLS